MLHLNYKKYGEGKPLIILHGFLGSLDNWHTLATRWGNNGFEVYAVDLRNHGRSPHTSHHSIDLMVEDILNFIDEQKLSKVNLLGHSMGGKVVMKFALTYPDRVEKLIVADIAPREYNRGHDEVFKAIFKVDLSKIQSRKEAEDAMKPYLGDFGTRQFILKSLDRDEAGNYKWKFNIKTLYDEYDEVSKAIISDHKFEGEVLFLKGGLSIYIQEKDMNDIKTLFPNARLQVVEHAGHWLHADKPDDFYLAVTNFLS